MSARNFTAILDFVPDFCPSCGRDIFSYAYDSNAAEAEITTNLSEAFLSGEVVTCPYCLLKLVKQAEGKPESLQAAFLEICDILRSKTAPPSMVIETAINRATLALGAAPDAQPAKVLIPLGWLAGQPVTVPQAVNGLSSEILGHAADLEERNEKDSAVGVKTLASQAYDLRRYGWALWLIHWQTLTPEQKAAAVVDPGSLAELVTTYGLTLPPDLAGRL